MSKIFLLLLISNRPLLSVMVKLTSEESFFSINVIVAFDTGCLTRVSKATPRTVPFFCAKEKIEIVVATNRSKNIFLIAIF